METYVSGDQIIHSAKDKLIVTTYINCRISQLITGCFGLIGLSQLHTKLISCSVRYVIVKYRPRGICGIQSTRLEGAKRPSSDWSRITR